MPTARNVFDAMAPYIGPFIEYEYGQRDLCILATKVAIEVAAYFGVKATPVPVQTLVYNAAFARHAADGFQGVDRSNVASWGDDSWSIGVGFGSPRRALGWDGHLLCVADGWFADFSIRQMERLEHDIVMPPALVGPYQPPSWKAERRDGSVTVEYRLLQNEDWRNAPDWREPKRRRKLAAKVIRVLTNWKEKENENEEASSLER